MARMTLRRGMVQLINLQTTGGGGSTIFTAGQLTANRQEVGAGVHVVPAGAYKVVVGNAGFEGNIDANGHSISPGGNYPFEHQFNKTNNVQDFTPEITITVPTGGEAWYVVQRPS